MKNTEFDKKSLSVVSKILNRLLQVIILILLIMSSLAILNVHWGFLDSETYKLSFDPISINNYISAYGEYKALFSATLATITAYFGLLRLKATTDANKDRLKQDRFSEWKTVLDIRLIAIEETDPYMKREFTESRYKLFCQLFDLEFSIENKDQLKEVFQSTFKDRVSFFEQQNKRHIRMGNIYPNEKHSYSFESFRFLFIGCINNSYIGIVDDLRSMYIANLPKDRIWNDPVLYKKAQEEYSM